MIDQFSKYINVAIIKNKSPTLKAFIKIWLSIFGAPKKLLSNNGGEFISDKVYEIREKFRIKLTTAPPYRPWSNGLCECHNQF